MSEDRAARDVVWLEKDPFPYQSVRDVIDIAGECVTNHGSISRRSVPAEQYIGRAKRLDEAGRDVLRGFTREAFQRMDTLEPEIRDSYTKYWNMVWDVCGYDQVTAEVGSEGTEPGSREAAALGVYHELNSPFTRELIAKGQKLLQEEKYHEMLKHVLDSELERAGVLREEFIPNMPSTHEAGLHMGYADALILISRMTSKVRPGED